jgi:succinoglycan biosynthesis protein ExoM
VDRLRASMAWPVSYMVEPERNIARARNRGVAEALVWGADFVAFVDDDERVCESWLATLLDVQAAFHADVVQGPVLRLLPERTPEWLRRGSGLEGQRLATGQTVRYAATANALVAARLLAVHGPAPFDPAFGLSGGSDGLFFSRCRREGARLVWANEAVVEEWVPERRASAEWLLRRAFREGNAALYCERAQPAELRQSGRQVLRGCARLAFGLGRALLVPMAGRAALLRSARHFAYAAGTLSALTGYRYYEYVRTPGSGLTGGGREGGARE